MTLLRVTCSAAMASGRAAKGFDHSVLWPWVDTEFDRPTRSLPAGSAAKPRQMLHTRYVFNVSMLIAFISA